MSPDANGDATRADVARAILVLDQLPELIVARRARLGHSVRHAATVIGTTYTNLSAIENRRVEPGLPTIRDLLDYLERGKR